MSIFGSSDDKEERCFNGGISLRVGKSDGIKIWNVVWVRKVLYFVSMIPKYSEIGDPTKIYSEGHYSMMFY